MMWDWVRAGILLGGFSISFSLSDPSDPLAPSDPDPSLVHLEDQPSSSGRVHIVEIHGIQFVPADIFVEAGDTVRWVNDGGFHTVTSGEDCEYDEIYFDTPLTPDEMIFEYEIPEDVVGVIPYFCRPHCLLNMEGSITVEGDDCIADLNDDGVVDAGDLAILLGAWGENPEHPADLNGDEVVDASDLAILLGQWAPCP